MRMNGNGELLGPDAPASGAGDSPNGAPAAQPAGGPGATSPSTTATGSGAPPAQPTSNQRSVDESEYAAFSAWKNSQGQRRNEPATEDRLNDIDRRIADTVRTETARQHALSDHESRAAMLPKQLSEYAKELAGGNEELADLIEARLNRQAETLGQPYAQNHALNGYMNVPSIDDVRKWASESGFGEKITALRGAGVRQLAQAAKAGKTAPNVAGPNRDNAAPPAGPEDKEAREARRDQQARKILEEAGISD